MLNGGLSQECAGLLCVSSSQSLSMLSDRQSSGSFRNVGLLTLHNVEKQSQGICAPKLKERAT